MATAFIRTIVLYFLIMVGLRLLGKRQIGELEPIELVLTLLIFIFAAFGAAAAGSSIVISILFSTFMLALDVLVSFIQAYVFTVLTAVYVSEAEEVAEEE